MNLQKQTNNNIKNKKKQASKQTIYNTVSVVCWPTTGHVGYCGV